MVTEKMTSPPAVCVFDSGIGGLNLLYECAKKLPFVNLYYYADNYNVPYGNLPDEKLFPLVEAAFSKIACKNPAAAVVACNTVTARCIDFLRRKYPFPIVGIQPAVKPAVKVGGRCLVLATEATVKSVAFNKLLSQFPESDIFPYACRDLAEFVERNIFSLPEILPPHLLPDVCADSVVLGCTHYAFVRKQVENKYLCPVFDGMLGTADHLREILGICDHFSEKERIIAFLGGDFNKNREIFDKLNKGEI